MGGLVTWPNAFRLRIAIMLWTRASPVTSGGRKIGSPCPTPVYGTGQGSKSRLGVAPCTVRERGCTDSRKNSFGPKWATRDSCKTSPISFKTKRSWSIFLEGWKFRSKFISILFTAIHMRMWQWGRLTGNNNSSASLTPFDDLSADPGRLGDKVANRHPECHHC